MRSSPARTSRSMRSPASSWRATCCRTGTSASCSATACSGTRPTAGSPTGAGVTSTGEPARRSSGWRSPTPRAWPTPWRSTSAWPRTTSGRGATPAWPATAPVPPTPTSRRRTTTSGPSKALSSWAGSPPLQRIEVWTALGDVREQAGLFDAALAAFRRATRLVGGDAVAAAGLLQRCSRVHERRGAYAAALRRLTEAHRLLDGRHDPEADAARARLLSFGATIRAGPGPARAGPGPGRGRGRRGPAHRRGERPGQGLPGARLGQHPAGPQRRTDPRRRGAGDLRAGGRSRQPGRGAHEPGLCRVLRRLVGRGPGALRAGAGGLPALPATTSRRPWPPSTSPRSSSTRAT